MSSLSKLIALNELLISELKAIEVISPCRRCGYCCKNKNIFITIPELLKISEYTRFPPRKFLDRKRLPAFLLKRTGEYCIFYRNSSCQIHEIKPFQCRLYPCLLMIDLDRDVKETTTVKFWKENKYFYFICP